MLSQDSAVSVATGYLPDGWGVGVRVVVWARFTPLHIIHTGSGACTASYPKGNKDSFLGGKAAGAWSWPLISN
jgi:hypothetical protein